MHVTARYRVSDAGGRNRLVSECHDDIRGHWLELCDGTEVVRINVRTLRTETGEILTGFSRAD